MMEAMRRGARLGAALAMAAGLLGGSPMPGGAAPAPSPAAPGPVAPPGAAFQNLPREVLHEVEPGQNLHLIAGYYYGDARQWERLWLANRDTLRNPNRLPRGAVLRVPVTSDWKAERSYADWLKMGGPGTARASVRGLPPEPAPGAAEGGEAPAGPGGQAEVAAPAPPPMPAAAAPRGAAQKKGPAGPPAPAKSPGAGR